MAETIHAGKPSVQADGNSKKQVQGGNSNVLSLPESVIKRDGSLLPFDSEKIRYAIQRAGAATSEFDANEASLLTA